MIEEIKIKYDSHESPLGFIEYPERFLATLEEGGLFFWSKVPIYLEKEDKKINYQEVLDIARKIVFRWKRGNRRIVWPAFGDKALENLKKNKNDIAFQGKYGAFVLRDTKHCALYALKKENDKIQGTVIAYNYCKRDKQFQIVNIKKSLLVWKDENEQYFYTNID